MARPVFEQLAYQQAAVDAVCGALAGQPGHRLAAAGGALGGPGQTLGSSGALGGVHAAWTNRLRLSPEQLLANVQAVQRRGGLHVDDALSCVPHDAGGSWPETPQLSVEMETGTGKTFVYLATLHRLARDFGLRKFVIVVPSVAIREGVWAAVKAAQEHLAARFGLRVSTWVHDRRRLDRVRRFAEGSEPQCLIVNSQAFDREANLLNRSHDDFDGLRPVDFLRAARPVLVLDEPQTLEGRRTQEALASLAPLLTLRYSATHRRRCNLLFRFGPVAAYDGGWVKRIEVDSVLEADGFHRPRIEVLSVEPGRDGPRAKLRVQARGVSGPSPKTLTVGAGADLEALTQRSIYRGWRVSRLDAGAGEVAFEGGEVLIVGQVSGPDRDALMGLQIQRAVAAHLQLERRMRRLPEPERMKVLTLFFIDRVAHYAPSDGKVRRWFEQAYEGLRAGRFADLGLPPARAVHGGYFAVDGKGRAKDSSGRSQADERAYELILRDKEGLLDRAQPLQFLFSHSALREGWDNPNVFQLCMLGEARSALRKRQELGRGLRLPVQADGRRCRDPELVRLLVVANESYDEFARQLQAEIAEDTGDDFSGRTTRRAERRPLGWQASEAEFDALHAALAPRARYRVGPLGESLVRDAAAAVAAMAPIEAPKLLARRARLSLDARGVRARGAGPGEQVDVAGELPLPDLLAELQQRVPLSRSSLARILVESGRLGDAAANPEAFVQEVAARVGRVCERLMAEGVTYEATGQRWPAGRWDRDAEGLATRLQPTPRRGLYEATEYRSEPERRFVRQLEEREDVRRFAKLPRWYRVPTPLGDFTPGWALLMVDGRVLVREAGDAEAAAPRQRDRSLCARVFFDAIGVEYAVVGGDEQAR